MSQLFLIGIWTLLAVSTKANVDFEIVNRERGPIWVGIQGNPGHPHLERGGFELGQGAARTITAPDNWAGRFWPRTWCDPNTKHCLTGDCGNKLQCNGAGGSPPATLVEITCKGHGGLDYYDISLVDGFNIRATIVPVGGQGPPGQYSCTQIRCVADINARCPQELQVRHDRFVIACNSACNKFRTDQYCCAGAHNRPETCRSSDWPKNYPAFFKAQCPDAYSYAYDDHKSTYTCRSSRYRIVFGPQ